MSERSVERYKGYLDKQFQAELRKSAETKPKSGSRLEKRFEKDLREAIGRRSKVESGQETEIGIKPKLQKRRTRYVVNGVEEIRSPRDINNLLRQIPTCDEFLFEMKIKDTHPFWQELPIGIVNRILNGSVSNATLYFLFGPYREIPSVPADMTRKLGRKPKEPRNKSIPF